jgi:probable HAF family extracellular repeat protein
VNRTILLVVAICASCAGAWATEQYTITSLGTFGGLQSSAYGINNAGQVVGSSDTAGGDYRAFLYSGGQMQDLGTLSGDSSSAFGINSSGTVAGYTYITAPGGPANTAFLCSGGQMQALGAAGKASTGYSINDSGQVVGESNSSSGQTHAVLYSNGQTQDLGTLTGDVFSSARGINNLGQVAGFSESAGGIDRAFLYSGGTMQSLGTLTGDLNSYAYSINNAGQVVGVSRNASLASHAFLYSGGQMLNLGSFGGPNSGASAINNLGQVVGYSDIAGGTSDAFLYSDGALTDLNTLIGPASSGWYLEQANGINDQGQIVGDGYNYTTHQWDAFLLSPVPEPLTMLAVGMGIAGLGGYIRRRRRS